MLFHQIVKAATETMIDIERATPIYWRFAPEHVQREHLRFMLKRIAIESDIAKANRWLGYMQGVAAGVYGVSLDRLRQINVEAQDD